MVNDLIKKVGGRRWREMGKKGEGERERAIFNKGRRVFSASQTGANLKGKR